MRVQEAAILKGSEESRSFPANLFPLKSLYAHTAISAELKPVIHIKSGGLYVEYLVCICIDFAGGIDYATL